uniref:Uncharacterized protein n=1 Tax=viral metagenome TaxID=1070528 RepID=A0A6M3L0V3_9ZZZZ
MTKSWPEPNPKRWIRIPNPEESVKERELDCKEYKNCLTHAANHFWNGFTCRFCELRKEGKNDAK